MTSNEQTAEFPAASLKAYVTVVVPTLKLSPGLLVWLDVTDPLSSVAVGSVQVTDTAAPSRVV